MTSGLGGSGGRAFLEANDSFITAYFTTFLATWLCAGIQVVAFNYIEL